MPQFKYKARDMQGTLVESFSFADDESVVRNQLTEKGLWIIELFQVKEKSTNVLDFNLDELFGFMGGVGLKDLVVFCRQFSVLINAGVSILKTLSILAEQTENKNFRIILKDIKNNVEQGVPLSDAFQKHDKVFDVLFINLLKAGETGGILDQVLNRIAKFMEDRSKLTDKIKSAMTYPTVVSIFAVIIFFVMLTVILPQFATLFAQLGSKLPAYTQCLIDISNVLRSSWLILIIFVCISIGFGFKKLYQTKLGRYKVDELSLQLPVLGPLLRKLAVARFTRTFGTLMKSGVPILTSLEIVEESSGNAVFTKAIKTVYVEIQQGGTINEPLEKSKVFPPMVVSMIAVGEETGELDTMLTKIADFYDAEIESSVDSLTSLIEPLMVIFLGGMVGAVIVGMYLPMFKLFDVVK